MIEQKQTIQSIEISAPENKEYIPSKQSANVLLIL